MRTKTLEQNSAQDLAGLYVDQLQKLRNGNMTFEQVKWFTNLSFKEREKLIGKQDLFTFSDFFTTKEGLFVYEDSQMASVRQAYLNPIPYKNVETLQSAFDLEKSMNDTEVIKKLGDEDEVRKNSVCMSQIEQLIKNQWMGKAGVMLNNGYANIFYVVGKDNKLFAVHVVRNSDRQRWRVYACELDLVGEWCQGRRVFSNKLLVF